MSAGRSAARGTKPARARDVARAAPAAPLSLLHPAMLLAALLCAACIATTVSTRIYDTDFWEHLVIGREIWRAGHVPMQQIWTWPTYGTNLVYDTPASWGFFALLWPFWERGEVTGLFVWRWLTTLVAFGLLWAAARRMGARGLVPLVALAWCALVYRQRSQLRPETLVAVLLALQLFIHESRRAASSTAGAARDLTLALPLIALAWVNVHLSYWLGLVIQAIYWLDAWWSARGRTDARATLTRLAAIGLVSGAVSLLNPGGWHTLLLPVQYAFVWSREPIFRFISELAPVDWTVQWRTGLLPLVVAWPLLLLWRWRTRGLDLAGTLLCALLLTITIPAQRFVGMLAVIAAPFVARDLETLVRSIAWPRWTAAAWARAGLAGVTCVAISVPLWMNPFEPLGVRLRNEWYPIAACDFMQQHGVRGRGYNHFFLGGYLLWRFFPERERLPFTDVHQAGTREDRALVAAAATDPGAWHTLDAKYEFDWVLLNRWRVEGDRSLDIADADTSCALVFLDDNAALYARRHGAMAAVADSFAYRVIPAGLAGTARLGAAVAQDTLLRRALAREVTRMRDGSAWNASANSMAANLALGEGRFADARDALIAALRVDPDLPYGRERLGIAALTLGRPREAYEQLKRAPREGASAERLNDLTWQARSQWRTLEARSRELAAAAARTPADAALAESLRVTRERLANAAP